jgi:acyl-CoA thioester hydrolase
LEKVIRNLKSTSISHPRLPNNIPMFTQKFEKKIELRWSDLDPNFHLKHSIYYDLAVQFRLEMMTQAGLTVEKMKTELISPILFREEAIFKKEILYGDTIFINLKLAKGNETFSKWGFRHELYKADGTCCSILNVEGAWLNLKTRKLAMPPAFIIEFGKSLPKTDDYQTI